MFWAVILSIAVGLVVFLKEYLVQYCRLKAWSSKYPNPRSLPLIGVGHRLMCKREEIFSRIREIVDERQQLVTPVWVGPSLLVIIKDADLAQKCIMSSKLIDRGWIMKAAEAFTGDGVITGAGPIQRHHRKIILSTLGTKSLPLYCSAFASRTSIMVDRIAKELKNKMAASNRKMADGGKNDNKADIEIFLEKNMLACAIEAVSEAILGRKFEFVSREDREVVEAFVEMYEVIGYKMMNLWINGEFMLWLTGVKSMQDRVALKTRNFVKESINLFKNKRIERIMQEVIHKNLDGECLRKNMSNGTVSEKTVIDGKDDLDEDTTTMIGENSEKRYTMLNQILDVTAKEKYDMTDKQLMDEMMTLFMAASDPVASIVSFCINMLAMHPEYQLQVYEEVQRVTEKYGSILDVSSCGELVVLERCLKETLRLFPIVPLTIRAVHQDFQIDDATTIPAGVTILLSLFNLQRNPDHWEKPELFYPDHFLPEQADKRHPYAFLPFSAGPRGCIGSRHAMICMKLMMVGMIRRFEFFPTLHLPVKDLSLSSDVSIRLNGGNRVILKERI